MNNTHDLNRLTKSTYIEDLKIFENTNNYLQMAVLYY